MTYPPNYTRAEAAYLREPDEPTDRCDICDSDPCVCDREVDDYYDYVGAE